MSTEALDSLGRTDWLLSSISKMNVVISFSVYSFTVLIFSGNPNRCTVLPYLFFDITGIQGFSYPLEKNLYEKIVLIFNNL